MQENYRFSQQMLQALAGGLSIIDFPRLRIHNIEQAYQFIRAYGYDPSDEADLKKIWLYHSRAVTYIRSYLVREGEEIPAEVGDPNTLKEIAFLFIYASTKDNKRYGIQYWACAVLRVMHVLAHLENDLFTKYSKDIQKQILAPFNQFVASDPIQGTLLKNIETGECIEIKKFETKSFKKSDSSITKLLAKKEAVALRILDKVGVRIVTKSVFDCYKVMRFLVDNHVINVANIIQSESLNSIYPIDSFLQVMENLATHSKMNSTEIDSLLYKKLEEFEAEVDEEETKKPKRYNEFSDKNYRFIKLIGRRRIKIQEGEEPHLQFFYPYEVQILDYQSFVNNLSGPASHKEYKKRQIERARSRVLGAESE